MRSAKGRKEVIKRIFVSDVDGRQPQAHLVFITFKYVVVTDGHIEKTAGRDPRRIAQDWQEGLDKFEKMREKYLIYK